LAGAFSDLLKPAETLATKRKGRLAAAVRIYFETNNGSDGERPALRVPADRGVAKATVAADPFFEPQSQRRLRLMAQPEPGKLD
jgi:hypothetical protein